MVDPSLYLFLEKDLVIKIPVYVDDLFIYGNCEKRISTVVAEIKARFEIREVRKISKCLGMLIEDDGLRFKLQQSVMMRRMLNDFNMTSSNVTVFPVPTGPDLSKSHLDCVMENNFPYQQLVGYLTYLENMTRPDIEYVATY